MEEEEEEEVMTPRTQAQLNCHQTNRSQTSPKPAKTLRRHRFGMENALGDRIADRFTTRETKRTSSEDALLSLPPAPPPPHTHTRAP